MLVLALWENTNQITHLIESMDKLTKEGKHRTATETLKACSGTFYCGLKIILHFLQYWKCLQKKSLTPENQNVLCSYCGTVYEAAEILCLAPANGCREGSSRCGNKKLAVTDDINLLLDFKWQWKQASLFCYQRMPSSKATKKLPLATYQITCWTCFQNWHI